VAAETSVGTSVETLVESEVLDKASSGSPEVMVATGPTLTATGTKLGGEVVVCGPGTARAKLSLLRSHREMTSPPPRLCFPWLAESFFSRSAFSTNAGQIAVFAGFVSLTKFGVYLLF
jgi:hypothetical protein